ncbi:MAG: hypothetical protein ACLTDS_00635 [Bianqueaceae bacterium]
MIFTQVDEDMERILQERAGCPDHHQNRFDSPICGIYAIRRSCFETTVEVYASFVSVAWRDAMGTGQCALIRHVEASHLGDNVIGYQCAGKTEEQ